MRSLAFATPTTLCPLVLLLACSGGGGGGVPDAATAGADAPLPADVALTPDSGGRETGPTATGPTYWQDIVPIVENKCMGCHQPAGIGPFNMGTYAEIKPYAPAMASAVGSGIMPPYYIRHDGTCGNFDDHVALTATEAQTLMAWGNGGAAEGTPGQVVVPDLPHLTDGTSYATPLYTPVAQGTAIALYDEYRCFLVDPALAADAFITGFEVTPGNAAIVHHVIGFAVDPSAPGDTGEANSVIMQRLHDASPDREGWPCFGAAGDQVSVAGVPVEWAPGQGVVNYPDGMGFQMKKSYRFVVQVHYNLADPATAGEQDSSIFHVRYASTVSRKLVFFLPDGFLDTLRAGTPDALPPGLPNTTYHWSKTGAQLGVPASLPYIELVGVLPHMHTRGIGQEMDLVGADGGLQCASALTRWDFHWQKFYFYRPGSYLQLTATTTLGVTCTYDTTAETNPVLPGWGTRNEMCLTVLMAALPPGA